MKILDILNESNWGKNIYNFNGKISLSAAFDNVYTLSTSPWNDDKYELYSKSKTNLHNAIYEKTGEKLDSISEFNDLPETTFEDIKEVCKLAEV